MKVQLLAIVYFLISAERIRDVEIKVNLNLKSVSRLVISHMSSFLPCFVLPWIYIKDGRLTKWISFKQRQLQKRCYNIALLAGSI